MNLGSGQDIRIGDLAQLITAKVDHPVKIQIDSARLRPEKSEVQRLVSDNRLALVKLGWSPQVDLNDGLQRTFEWISQNLSHYTSDRYVT
jgi:dTDP-glucose 4,6-dehydratase